MAERQRDGATRDITACQGADSVFALVLDKLAHEPALILRLWPRLLPHLRYLALLQDAHAADRDSTGTCCEKLMEIARLAKLATAVTH